MQGVYEAKVKNFKHKPFFSPFSLKLWHKMDGIDIYWQRCAQEYSLSHVAPGQRSLT